MTRDKRRTMKFLMIHWIDDAALPAVGSPEEIAFDRDIDAWDAEMQARGVLAGGARLQPVDTAAIVCTRYGEVLATDGPFAETKEQIAGFVVLECANLAEAIEISSRHPTVRYGTFELRAYLD
jgi:hypothetical protein